MTEVFMSIQDLIAANNKRFTDMKVFPNPVAQFVAKKLLAGKARYQEVSKTTGVPWEIIAVIHQREASQSWKANIANGDPWNKPTIHVPRGRGPFPSWEAAAVDALTNCAPHAAKWKDWSWGGALTLLEMYNGLGYANKGRPSPYIWSGTNQYVKGKYVADGHYDPNAIDHQIGCAVLLSALGYLKS
jgi:lysozyme family protein